MAYSKKLLKEVIRTGGVLSQPRVECCPLGYPEGSLAESKTIQASGAGKETQ